METLLRFARRFASVVPFVPLAPLVMAACSSSSPAPAPATFADASTPPPARWTSGTRLRANVQDAGGGAVSLASWHDTQLGVDCHFRLAADNQVRCLPGDEVILTARDADEDCTQPLVPATDARYALGLGSTCPNAGKGDWEAAGPVDVFDVDSARVTGAFVRWGDHCVLDPKPGSYQRITPADPTRFARADIVTEAHGAVAARIAVTDDGAREILDLFDPAHGVVCVPDKTSGRCLPRWQTGDWADCNDPSASFIEQDCPAPAFMTYPTNPNACTPRAVLRVGPVLTEAPPNTDCEATSPPYAQAYALTPMPLDAFPPARAGIVTGTARVVLTQSGVDDAPLMDVSFVDTQLGFTCKLQVALDGVLRCLPDAPLDDASVFFTDAACTQPTTLGTVDPPRTPADCPSPTKYFYNTDRPTAYALGVAVDGPVYEIRQDGSCGELGSTPPHVLLTPLSLSTFAAITLRTE